VKGCNTVTAKQQEVLLAEMRAGSVEAGNRLVRSIMPWVNVCMHPLAYSLDLPRDDIDSALGLAVARALRHWDPKRGALVTLVRICCRNELLRASATRTIIAVPERPKEQFTVHVRQAKRSLPFGCEEPEEPRPGPSYMLERADRDRLVRDAVLMLPEPERTLISRMFFQDVSMHQVGRELYLSPKHVQTICHRGLRSLESLLGTSDTDTRPAKRHPKFTSKP
jgi:RNA polymerase sigma factor (sigma-70 family)